MPQGFTIAEVALLKRLPRTAHVFDYQLPEGGVWGVGDLVEVSFRRNLAQGIVLKLKAQSRVSAKLKPVGRLLAPRYVTPQQLKVTEHTAHHYGVAWGQALTLAVPFLPNRNFVPEQVSGATRATPPRPVKPVVITFGSPVQHLQAVLALLERVCKRKQQVLLLVPELHYLSVWQSRLKGYRVATFSAELKLTEQRLAWAAVRSGEAQVVVGTRAALFLPFNHLGGVVVDYAENESYKQAEQNPRYDGLEVARWLAAAHGASLAYLSPAPPLSLWYEAETGAARWQALNARASASFELVDLAEERRAGNYSVVSHALQERVTQTLDRGGKVFLYLNRRGSATTVTCRDCGFSPTCPTCKRPMVWSAKVNKLTCFHCGVTQAMPLPCPECGGSNVAYLGQGLERAAEELKKLWPRVKLSVLEGELSEAPPQLASANIVLGSRLAWRYVDFSTFEFVAALLPDTELSLPEYRAAENTFATMRFLATCGAKRLVVQTWRPEHYLWQSMSQNLPKFYQAELTERKAYNYPPFTSLVRLTSEHKEEQAALVEAKGVARLLESALPKGATFTGPYPDYYHQVRGRYRFHLLLRYQRGFNPETLWPKLPDGILIDRHPWSILR